MTSRSASAHGSVWEAALVPVLLAAAITFGMLWTAGVLVGSFLGATLPGSVGVGFGSMVRAFPSVGDAWSPVIPSVAVWWAAIGLVAILLPLVWRLVRAMRLDERGANWASPAELRKAGLLLADRPLMLATRDSVDDAK